MADFDMPKDRFEWPVPVLPLRQGGATTQASVGIGGVLSPLITDTPAVSVVCIGGTGRVLAGDGTLTAGDAEHFIQDGERLTFAVRQTDTQLALKADIATVTFEISEYF